MNQEIKSDTDQEIQPECKDSGYISICMSGYIDFQDFIRSDSKVPDSILDISKYRQLPPDLQTNIPLTMITAPHMAIKSESFGWSILINRHTSIRPYFPLLKIEKYYPLITEK